MLNEIAAYVYRESKRNANSQRCDWKRLKTILQALKEKFPVNT